MNIQDRITKEQNQIIEETFTYLRNIATLTNNNNPEFKYKNIHDFIVQEGIPYVEHSEATVTKGRQGNCFGNAFELAIKNKNYTYVEGVAYSDVIPLDHAWILDEKNKVIETTWQQFAFCYIGVPFPTNYIIKTVLKEKRYGILDRYQSHWPLLTGKDDYSKIKLDLRSQ